MIKSFADVAVDPTQVLSVSRVKGGQSTMIVQPKEGQQCVVVISLDAADALINYFDANNTI